MQKWKTLSDRAQGRVQAAVAAVVLAVGTVVSLLAEWGIDVCAAPPL